MADYHLYMHRNSYAMSTHLLLEELGIDYAVTWFNVHKPEEFPADFLQLNPNARVPLLITPDGPIYESAATMMYLSEKHSGQFMPATHDSKRGQFLQWMFYLMSTFQPEVLIQFNAERYFPEEVSMQQALKSASLRELETLWHIIDDALKPGPWFLGEKYSLCDMLFLMQAIWVENQPVELAQFPHAVNMMRSAFKRSAVEQVLIAHGIEALSNI
ncbi:MAG: glutathione S-transferase family protein [Chromatiales bacterium]|nr:glutathione S-transferase family protein [Chromatiales bacterium]